MTQRASNRRRVDQLLCEQGLAPSRARAQELIAEGRVTVEGRPVDKGGQILPSDAVLTVTGGSDFVSRGGRKLESALVAFGVDVAGLVVADVGASTGGFTDCALRRGAAKIYAVDVGAGQLAKVLRDDPRVVVKDRTNARELTAADFDDPLDLVLVDASFIGIEKLTAALARILPSGGTLLALVKPQFQVGREAAKKARGVVRDEALREEAIAGARIFLGEAGFEIVAERDSEVHGPEGNVERFVLARRR